jgi:hypothetical protein
MVLAGIPAVLRDPLLGEFNKLIRNFREGRWEPAELNGGKLSEIVYTILQGHVDDAFPAAPSKPSNMVDACRQLEKATSFPRSIRIQIPRVLLALYEIRNNRNVSHVGADVDPNHMDSLLVVSMAKWIMAELIRVFHGTSTDEAARVVESLTERTVPLLWRIGTRVRVLGSGLSASDKMLVVLYGEARSIGVKELAETIEYGNTSRFRDRIVLDAHRNDLVHFDRASDSVLLSPVGVRYVETEISLEL